MTALDAIATAAKYGASIGHYKPGIYYVSFVQNGAVQTVHINGKHLRCTVDWIKENLNEAA